MSDKPEVIRIGKNASEEARDDYPENMDDEGEGGTGNPWYAARDNYPEDVEEELEDETDVELDPSEEKSKGEEKESDEKAFSLKEYNITNRIDREKQFSDIKSGDIVLVEDPLDGAKTGEVTSVDESWTGILSLSVDTGAQEYQVSPINDEFDTRLVAAIDGEGSLSSDLLSHLSKTTIDDLEVGKQIFLDIPHIGPVRGTVSNMSQTKTQGKKVDVSTGITNFTVYESPSPLQSKEQSQIIGTVNV